ncbi:PAS domain-containing protein [Varunaivibrio sulfuroxidans]|uniref:histidine kinase n=2 Tax=Varunaivibrio sulfuroxidans TaxID=1773489 RepID=A0A4R3J6W9_9PROT|nr:PAS domain-containing protein [Varunaivibrio sulfuroxidans]
MATGLPHTVQDVFANLPAVGGWLATIMACLVAAGFASLWTRERKAHRKMRLERARLVNDAEISHEILATAPDGLFLWVLANGTEACSRRLAVMMNLPDGIRTRFDTLIERFDEKARRALGTPIENLRRHGETFTLIAPTANGRRWVHIIGVRAGTPQGKAVADVLWIRDLSSLGALALGGDGALLPTSAHAVLDALPLPVWVRDEDLAITFANRAAGGGVGTAARDLARRAVSENHPLTERHLLTLDERPRLFEITENPLGGAGGSVGFAVDQTQTEELQATFARGRAAQNQVLETLNTAIAIFDADTTLIFFNRACARLWDIEAGWLKTEPPYAEVLERLRERRKLPEVADFPAYKGEQIALFKTVDAATETLMHLPDGATLRALVGPYPLGGLVMAFEDVTGRLDLERLYKTLSAVQRETLDNLYEGVAVFASDGRMRLCNPSFVRLWELSDDAPKQGMHIAAFVDQSRPLIDGVDDWDNFKERTLARMMNREPQGGRIEQSGGRVLDYAKVALPDGAVLLSYLDVTDSVRVERALMERAEAMAEANLLKSEFMANVSHEIRTPLNTIIGFASILADEYFGKLNARQSEYTRGIVDSANDLTTVIDDILDLATIEAGLMALELDTVDVGSMLTSVLNLARERAKRKNLHLNFDCPTDIGWLVADEKRLKQVLFNLLSNAITRSPAGGDVDFIARRDTARITFTISDSGRNIAPQNIYHTFHAVTPNSPAPGKDADGLNGLGLSLVTRFIELHDGRIEILPRRGKNKTKGKNGGVSIVCHLPTGAPALSPDDTDATSSASPPLHP